MFGGHFNDNLRGDNPFGMNFGFFNNSQPQSFDEHYRCYPVSFCDKSHLEDGDKILLPPSALETLARLHIDYPMLFRLENETVKRYTHCGVLEFSAPEGTCYMPYWMMQNLFISEGNIINIKNATLPKATFVKIRPQSVDFLDITNPRAVLEASFRTFSCMTVGDTIRINYNNKHYSLDVREVRPAEAACIIETDCEVDFEAPVDYVEPKHIKSKKEDDKIPVTIPYGGVPTILDNELSITTSNRRPLGSLGGLRMNHKNNSDVTALRAARLKKYEVFHGTGVTLNSGKKIIPENPTILNQNNDSKEYGLSLQGNKLVMNDSINKNDTKLNNLKSPLEPFQGEGRRLR